MILSDRDIQRAIEAEEVEIKPTPEADQYTIENSCTATHTR